MEASTDKELIQRILSGEESAFALLIKRHQKLVATTALNMLGNYDDAEEAGQETFIKLYKGLSRFNGEAQLSTYINRICINVCLTKLKKRQSWFARFSNIEEGYDQRGTLAEFDRKDDDELVRKALSYLDIIHRSVIVLRMIEGYSTIEAAEILGIPEGTILSRLKRGMAKLKQILIEKFNYEY